MKNGASPLVSVLMTAYNREQYIGEAIESVLKSTYDNFELIITDDCSADQTLAIARDYEKKDSRIKVYLNNANLKDYPNRNNAARFATGKYIKYLDSDDMIYPDGLEYCVDAMERFPEAGIGMLFFQKDLVQGIPACWDNAKIIQHHFFKSGCLNIGPSGSIIRRDVFENHNGFDTRFGVASDNFFNISVAAKYPVVLLPKEFFFYREHDGQEIKDKRGYLQYNYLYLKELLATGSLPISDEQKSALQKRIEKTFAKDLLRYSYQSGNLTITKEVMNVAGFTLTDLVNALLNQSKKI